MGGTRSLSPWALPLLPVKKKDRRTRWVDEMGYRPERAE